MLRYMLRQLVKQGILGVALLSFFSSLNLAVADSQNELTKKFSLAQNLAQKGELDQAIAAYTSLIITNPQLPEVYNNLAALYLKKNDTQQAKKILEQGLNAHKGYAALYDSLTAINVAMAREAYSKALQIKLKPAEITIASVSLNKSDSGTKTQIVSKEINPDDSSQKEIVSLPVNDAVREEKISNEITHVKVEIQPVKNPESVETVLKAWSAAWSAQAVDMYLSFYHSNFKPSNGLSRNDWEQSRRLKLKKPGWIKIGLSDFNIEKNDSKQAIVKFKQSYQSDRYRDVSLKRLVLFYTDTGWRILREKSI